MCALRHSRFVLEISIASPVLLCNYISSQTSIYPIFAHGKQLYFETRPVRICTADIVKYIEIILIIDGSFLNLRQPKRSTSEPPF